MSNNTNVQVFLTCVTYYRNEDGVYERMGDDQVYEQLDEPDLLAARKSAVDTSSSTAYENTTCDNGALTFMHTCTCTRNYSILLLLSLLLCIHCCCTIVMY